MMIRYLLPILLFIIWQIPAFGAELSIVPPYVMNLKVLDEDENPVAGLTLTDLNLEWRCHTDQNYTAVADASVTLTEVNGAGNGGGEYIINTSATLPSACLVGRKLVTYLSGTRLLRSLREFELILDGTITGALSAGSTSTSLISTAFVATEASDYQGWIVCVNVENCSIVRTFNPSTDTIIPMSSVGTVSTGMNVQLIPSGDMDEMLQRIRTHP